MEDSIAQTPLISVVVPAYNSAKTLARSLDSVLDQHDPALELVVVDDGSTDESAEIALAYAHEHKGMRVVQQSNAGPSAARNTGMDVCTGEWILFLDADDSQEPKTLATLRSAMDEGIDALVFPVQKLLASGEVLREPGYTATTNAQGMAECILLPHGPYQGYMTNKCVRTSVVRATGHMDVNLRYCEDEEWWLRVAATLQRLRGRDACVRILDEHLYNYHQETDGLRQGGLLNVSTSARDAIVTLTEQTWPELATLARQKHALWQNRVVVRVLRAKGKQDPAVLCDVLRPKYRKDIYQSSHVGFGTKAKTWVLGVAGAALSVRARRKRNS